MSVVTVKLKGLWKCLDVLKCLYLAFYYCKQNGYFNWLQFRSTMYIFNPYVLMISFSLTFLNNEMCIQLVLYQVTVH